MTESSKVSSKVNDILKSLNKPKPDIAEVVVESKEKVVKPEIPRGKPKSGRIWKTQKQRFSTINKTKGAHQSFAVKAALRIKLQEVKQASREIQERKKAAKEMAKERRRENIKKTEENRIKSEIVQVISNSSKVKRMKKKQLRFIEKRDTTKVSK